MVRYYAVEEVDVVHILYNLHSGEESDVWSDTHTGPALSFSCHPVITHRAGRVGVHSAHVQGQQP